MKWVTPSWTDGMSTIKESTKLKPQQSYPTKNPKKKYKYKPGNLGGNVKRGMAPNFAISQIWYNPNKSVYLGRQVIIFCNNNYVRSTYRGLLPR